MKFHSTPSNHTFPMVFLLVFGIGAAAEVNAWLDSLARAGEGRETIQVGKISWLRCHGATPSDVNVGL